MARLAKIVKIPYREKSRRPPCEIALNKQVYWRRQAENCGLPSMYVFNGQNVCRDHAERLALINLVEMQDEAERTRES